MQLENNYYNLTGFEKEEKGGTFHIVLRKECLVYEGHFPGKPVCPGVFSIQIAKECAERLVGRPLHIISVRLCRFKAVATPATTPRLTVRVETIPCDDGYVVTATLSDEVRIFMEYKGKMCL